MGDRKGVVKIYMRAHHNLQALACTILLLSVSACNASGGASVYASQVGDIIDIGDSVTAMVLGWGKDDVSSQAGGGEIVITVDVVLVNKSDLAIFVTPILQMLLQDSASNSYSLDFNTSRPRYLCAPTCEIGPGERMRIQPGFQVPEDAIGLELVLDGEYWSASRVLVELGPEPITAELPATLPGERELEVFSVGDAIQLDEFLITVNEATYSPGAVVSKFDEGSTFVVVDVTIGNTGDRSLCVLSYNREQMYLKDNTGQLYEIDSTASAIGVMPVGVIAPGEKTRGQAGFQVPEGAGGLVFVFDNRAEPGKVFVTLPR